MDINLLKEILIVVYIVVGVALTVALVKVVQILMDVKDTSGVMIKRVRQVDASIDKARETFSDISNSIKSFATSFNFVKIVAEKIKEYTASDKGSRKAKNDGEE